MRTYTQLTQEQRYQIYALLKMGHCQSDIAQVIGVDKSTISREVRRNRGGKRLSSKASTAIYSDTATQESANKNCTRNLGLGRRETAL